jgi:hypothetical protein
MVFWSDLYKEIAGRITANLKNIRWVDLWHEQVSFLDEELPFPAPAVFIGFGTISADDTGQLVQQCSTQIDMYLFFETFSDTYDGSSNRAGALEFLEELTRLHALFHGKSGENYSAMRRIDMNRMDSGGAGNLYRISFECLVTDYSAQELFTEIQNPAMELEISRNGAPEEDCADGTPMFDVGQ